MSLISDKEKIITNSYNVFAEDVKRIERDIFEAIMLFLKKNLDASPSKRYLSKVNKELSKILSTSRFVGPVRKFLKNFDTVEKLARKQLSFENGIDLKELDLAPEKLLEIDEIINGLLNKQMVDANLHQPLRKILYRYSTTNINLKQAEDELRKFIVGDTAAGFAERYVRPLAIESLSRFDGAINQRVVTEYDLDGFRIVGSLIKTSQRQCIQMVNETGELGAFAVNGKYAMADLPKIIEKLRASYPGVYSGLNVSNFFIYRNHYGCRHQFIPTRLLEKDLAVLKARNGQTPETPKYTPENIGEYEKATGAKIDRSIFGLLEKPITLSFDAPKDRAYYDPAAKSVHIDVKRGERYSSEAKREMIIYHEFGHAIDDQKRIRESSAFNDLVKRNKKIFTNSKRTYDSVNNNLRQISFKAYKEKDNTTLEQATAAADTLMAFNKNYGAGHTKKYMSKKWRHEIVAHMFEVKYLENPVFKEVMPELYKDLQDFKIE